MADQSRIHGDRDAIAFRRMDGGEYPAGNWRERGNGNSLRLSRRDVDTERNDHDATGSGSCAIATDNRHRISGVGGSYGHHTDDIGERKRIRRLGCHSRDMADIERSDGGGIGYRPVGRDRNTDTEGEHDGDRAGLRLKGRKRVGGFGGGPAVAWRWASLRGVTDYLKFG